MHSPAARADAELSGTSKPSGPGSSVSPCAFDNDGWLLGSYLPGARCTS